MKKKLFVFDNIVAIMVVSLLGALGLTAFGPSLDPVMTLFLFAGMSYVGVGLAIAGTFQLLLKRGSHVFGSLAIILFGALGIFMGVAGQEALSGQDSHMYRLLLKEHFLWMSVLICVSVAAHIFMERPIIKRHHAG